ncbi:MAG TPA: hypothetical protein VGV37_11030, partial [Aliidongia sp.]|uniref:hypothetical protein n=1 Tax=Aliidongia sp. TaxID=1914230 RepID=UPI002DDCCF5B
EALALATKNDADILVPIEQAAHPFPGGEVSLVATSPYEASRLLAPESWATIAAKNGGQLLVAAPGTDVMIYMDARRPNAVDTMRRAVGVVAMKATRPLSSQIFKWSPAGWALVQQ